MKARFIEQQPPVKIVNKESISYIYLCLNEEYKTETYPGIGNEQTKENYYEYDYNEIIAPTDKLPLDDIQDHTEKYLNYSYSPDDNGRISKLEEQINGIMNAIERGLTT